MRSALAGRRPTPAGVITAAAVLASALFVFWQLRPSLLFADTTPAGGDMGAHVWLPAYIRDHLLPNGRITGWAPDWYAGFPALQFYFPIPSLLIVLLDVFLPYGVAFKLVSVSGVVMLPVAAWAFARLAGMRFPGPACLAVATVPFLFDRAFTIYGGNIPSTLAGEFSFAISLCLALLFLGVAIRGLDTGKHRALAAVLLALTAMSHVIPTFFALGAWAVVLIFRADRHRMRWVIPVGIVSLLVASFWVVPFLARLAYTNDMGWEKIVTYRKDLFPPATRWVPIVAAAGAVSAIVRRRRVGTVLALVAVGSAVAFVVAPQSRIWNARLLPFWFLSLYLLVGVAATELAHFIGDVRAWRAASLGQAPPVPDERVTTEQHRGPELLAPIALLVAVLTFVGLPLHAFPSWFPLKTDDRSFIPDWVKWNYSGYERKPAFPEYRDVIAMMNGVGKANGCGRAMWEYEGQLDRLGTPMALMLLPHWTDGCIASMEGLYFESSATTPYHFLNAAEVSKAPSNPQRDLPYKSLDLQQGIRHLQMLGVRYYMVFSPEAKQQAELHPDLTYLASSGPWSVSYPDGAKDRTWDVYEISDSDQVEPLAYEPVVVTGDVQSAKAWLDLSVPWYQDATRWPVPLAQSGPKEWRRVELADAEEPPRRRVPTVRVSGIETDDNEIRFKVDKPGSPVLVKTSFFPNWKASGARGPWRVTPNLMVVIPTEREVRLYYGTTGVDLLGWLLTLIGLAGVVWLARRDPVQYPPADGDGTGEVMAPVPPPPDADSAPVLVSAGEP